MFENRSGVGVLIVLILFFGIVYFEIDWDQLTMIVVGTFIFWAVAGAFHESVGQKKWEEESENADDTAGKK